MSALGAWYRPSFGRVDPHAGGVSARLSYQRRHERDVLPHHHAQRAKAPDQLHPHASRGAEPTQKPL
jgi:hypothetical protein